jgi:zinc/manganese transport system substrate-binding protein
MIPSSLLSPLSFARPSLLALAGCLCGLLLGCGAMPPPQGTGPQASGGRPDRPLVLTTVLPITLFTRAVAGDCAEVRALIPAASSPHDFQANPADLAALGEARVLVTNGLGLEDFLGRLLEGAANPGLRVIDSSRGIATLENQPAAAAPPADHAHDHAHGQVNPHIWLDPRRAARQVENIRDGLIAADPACAEGYRRQAAAFLVELGTLDAELQQQLAPFRGRTFVVLHDFAPYFAERYGLKAEYLVDVPEQNPSPADLARVAQTVKRTQLRALLSEPQAGPRSFNALAADLGLRLSVFDPLEVASEAASRKPATYGAVMRRNARDLVSAFR